MNLYHIANEYQQALARLDEENNYGEAFGLLDALEKNLEEKAIAVASYIKNVEAQRKAIGEAKKAMAEREARLDKKVEQIRAYLKENMERCGIMEISLSPYFTIKLKKCPPSVIVTNEELLDNEYKKVQEVITIDKMKLKDHLMNGVIIEGVSLVQNNRLEIK